MQIETIAVVGGGTMGQRIAFGCLLGRRRTRVFDVVSGVAETACLRVGEMVRQRVADRRLPDGTESVLRLLEPAESLQQCVEGADLVFETVPENVELKQQVFAEIDRYLGPTALLSTNTSSIPGSWLACCTHSPERVFNANWGTPDHLKIEVMGHPGTAPQTLAAGVEFFREIGLVPIVVKGELVGYATNRIWRAVKKEVLKLLDAGYLTPEEVDRAWMLDWGTPIGPCGLMDKIGLDVVRDIEMIYCRASGDPSDAPPPLVHRMIAEGKLGVKTGVGFYTYPDPAYKRKDWLTGEDAAPAEPRR